MNFFLKHKIVILRAAGALMLLLGFIIHFWSVPQKGLSANQIAAANVARMEKRVAAKGQSATSKKKKSYDSFLKEMKKTQKQKEKYFTILAMIFGIAAIGYTFVPQKQE